MKYTLIEMVKTLLGSLGSDEVNSWSATTESEQVTWMLRDVFNQFITDKYIPEIKGLITLTPFSDPLKPTHFSYPASISSIDWIRYNISEDPTEVNMRLINYKSPEDFLEMSRDLFDTYTVDVGDFIYIRNDTMPSWWTSLDDSTIIMNGLDLNVEATLQASKVQAYGVTLPTFQFEDTWVPPIDDALFPALISKAKVLCFFELKQQSHPIADRDYRRAQIRSMAHKYKYNPANRINDYGRR